MKVNSNRIQLPVSLHNTDFTYGISIGHGRFGSVAAARFKQNGSVWAIKISRKDDIKNKKMVHRVNAERKLVAGLHHPLIASLTGSFQDTTYLYYVYEYIYGCNFVTHLQQAKKLDVQDAQFYATQVAQILKYLHEQNIIHRDITPESFMIDHEGYLKLTNFINAKKVIFKTYTLCGLPEYHSPEMILYNGYGKETDWWQYGIFLFEMLTGTTPFISDNPLAMYRSILSGQVVFPATMDKTVRMLLEKLLMVNVSRRLGCGDSGSDIIANHSWFRIIDTQRILSRELKASFIPPANSTIKLQDHSKSSDFPHLHHPDITVALVPNIVNHVGSGGASGVKKLNSSANELNSNKAETGELSRNTDSNAEERDNSMWDF